MSVRTYVYQEKKINFDKDENGFEKLGCGYVRTCFNFQL